jgi:two-component system response regulator HydG
MPLEMQAKLLRVLQERKVRPLGSNSELPFDTRVVSATNRDLESEVEEGRFREDLYYRLNVVQIHIPPLRARGNDILLLAQHFVERVAERLGKPVKGISSDAAKKLLAYDWPGNVRQLENWMERAVALTSFDQITVSDLPDKVQHFRPAEAETDDLDAEHMLTMQEVENRHIERVLRATGGNKALAARILGMDRRTLYRKLEREEASSSAS